MAAKRKWGSKRRWGYVVWVVAGAVIVVPELTAAVDGHALPFTTISAMVGHLERNHAWVELVVVAAIVFVVFSIIRLPPHREAATGGNGARPPRTLGGRLTLRAAPAARSRAFDEDDAPVWFALAAGLSLVAIASATFAVSWWWDDGHHYRPAYVLYGLLALLWLVVPSFVAVTWGRDPPFPTLFRSVSNLEAWLRKRNLPGGLAPALAWLVGYVILAGLVILLLHLTLYPYPDITRIINPSP
jgi:hypothetical protein